MHNDGVTNVYKGMQQRSTVWYCYIRYIPRPTYVAVRNQPSHACTVGPLGLNKRREPPVDIKSGI